jgi:hypothetical protein
MSASPVLSLEVRSMHPLAPSELTAF